MNIEDPIIWRRMAVPASLNFHQLHLMLQAAMGWENQHMYAFQENIDTKYFSFMSPYIEEGGVNAKSVSATNILYSYLNQVTMDDDEVRDKMCYQYDFGDDWMHEIDVVDLDRSNKSQTEFLDGAGACPPENCGGIHGFQMFKDFLSGRMSKEEYYDHFNAVDNEEFDIHALNLHHLKVRVKGWKLMDY